MIFEEEERQSLRVFLLSQFYPTTTVVRDTDAVTLLRCFVVIR